MGSIAYTFVRHSARIARALAIGAAAVGAGLAGVASACAQTWPTRPVILVVPYVPGGATDVLARLYAERLSPALGQPVVVDNKPGGGTTIAAGLVAKAAPDGHTLLTIASPTFTNAAALAKDVIYDPIRDFAAIGLLGTQSFLLAINASLPQSTFGELIAFAKANPGKLNYGSPGIGSPHHLGMELLKSLAGIDLVHVPYRGGGQLVQDVLAGMVPVMFGSWVIAGPHIRTGKLKGLANSSIRPMTQAPNVPAIASLGFPDFDVEAWFGLAAPGATPKPVLERLNREVQRIAAEPDVRQRMLTVGYDPPPADSVGEFAERLKRDRVRWGKVIQEAGIKAE